MALSNIFREPRREITESIIGIVAAIGVVGGGIWIDYRIGCWIESISGTGFWHTSWEVGMGLGFIGLCALIVAAEITHALGESICEALADKGYDPRPRRLH